MACVWGPCANAWTSPCRSVSDRAFLKTFSSLSSLVLSHSSSLSPASQTDKTEEVGDFHVKWAQLSLSYADNCSDCLPDLHPRGQLTLVGDVYAH